MIIVGIEYLPSKQVELLVKIDHESKRTSKKLQLLRKLGFVLKFVE